MVAKRLRPAFTILSAISFLVSASAQGEKQQGSGLAGPGGVTEELESSASVERSSTGPLAGFRQ